MSLERILDYNADVAEFCPHPSVENVLAVGTYELDETSRNRHGKLYVFRLIGDIRDGQLGLEDPSAILLPGILDMSWVSSEVSDGAQVAVALADSTVAIFNVCDLEGRIGMQDICRMDFNEGEMVLAVDTCTTAAPSSLCASGSLGNVAIFNVRRCTTPLCSLLICSPLQCFFDMLEVYQFTHWTRELARVVERKRTEVWETSVKSFKDPSPSCY
jgi:hypothetical protein